MRIFLLPVSTRRTLIYCERLQPSTSANGKLPIQERIINRAAQTWADWERADKGWRKQLVVRGNKLLSRIAFEEWGLKSFPPLTKARIEDIKNGNLKFECIYPSRFLSSTQSSANEAGASIEGKEKDGIAQEILTRLATERQSLHRRQMLTSLAWMPITIPFTLVPVIPNIPFFYLCFRAYSHFRALYGGRMLAHLTSTPGMLPIRSSKELEELYARGMKGGSEKASEAGASISDEELDRIAKDALSEGDKAETILLRAESGTLFAEKLGVPAIQIEMERAVAQVRSAIEKRAQESTNEVKSEKESK